MKRTLIAILLLSSSLLAVPSWYPPWLGSGSGQLTTNWLERMNYFGADIQTNANGIFSDGSISPNKISSTATNSPVPKTTSINAGDGLTGGGDLSGNRTLSIRSLGVANGHLTNGAVTAEKILDGTITTNKVNGEFVDCLTNINGSRITKSTITTNKVDGTFLDLITNVSGGRITANSISTNKLDGTFLDLLTNRSGYLVSSAASNYTDGSILVMSNMYNTGMLQQSNYSLAVSVGLSNYIDRGLEGLSNLANSALVAGALSRTGGIMTGSMITSNGADAVKYIYTNCLTYPTSFVLSNYDVPYYGVMRYNGNALTNATGLIHFGKADWKTNVLSYGSYDWVYQATGAFIAQAFKVGDSWAIAPNGGYYAAVVSGRDSWYGTPFNVGLNIYPQQTDGNARGASKCISATTTNVFDLSIDPYATEHYVTNAINIATNAAMLDADARDAIGTNNVAKGLSAEWFTVLTGRLDSAGLSVFWKEGTINGTNGLYRTKNGTNFWYPMP